MRHRFHQVLPPQDSVHSLSRDPAHQLPSRAKSLRRRTNPPTHPVDSTALVGNQQQSDRDNGE